MRFSRSRVLNNVALPESRRSWPGSSLSRRTSSTRLPLIGVDPGHSTLSSVEETTYLGIVFILTPKSPVSVIKGHAAANPWYVVRPSSSASLACSSAHLKAATSSSKNGPDHMPGSSQTPSSDTYSVATSLMTSSSRGTIGLGRRASSYPQYEGGHPESTARADPRGAAAEALRGVPSEDRVDLGPLRCAGRLRASPVPLRPQLAVVLRAVLRVMRLVCEQYLCACDEPDQHVRLRRCELPAGWPRPRASLARVDATFRAGVVTPNSPVGLITPVR